MQAYVSAITEVGNADYGKFRFYASDELATSGANYSGDIRITSPIGAVIRDFGAGTSFPPGTSMTAINAADIPVDANGNWLLGTYMIQVRVLRSGYSADYTASYYLGPKSVKKCVLASDETGGSQFNIDVVCSTAKILFKDATSYTGWTVTSRVVSVIPPNLPGAPSVLTDYDIGPGVVTKELTFSHVNATWQATLLTKFSKENNYTSAGGFTLVKITNLDAIRNSETQFVVCESSLCSVYACMKSLFLAMEARACAAGGWAKLSAADLQKWSYLNALMTMSRGALLCSNEADAQMWLVKMKDALAVDCGCGCDDSVTTDPIPYTPAV